MTDPAPPGWISAGTIDGVPLWRRTSEPVWVAATDRDQLVFLDVALEWFDMAGPQEFVAFIERRKKAQLAVGSTTRRASRWRH
ncbi:hypothetical protein NE236_00130 [Actinoallomurus purpureus]|uniref:hypothetical protein n=1 Tax=Actinoallomurus purpureus TaxID=478114 RepID=UPI0020924C0C|nr:hypothetical protein [Actinoallomurus purpureus]MCO6003384.1 hypothetical protein [Actinoallomurus purpureus]